MYAYQVKNIYIGISSKTQAEYYIILVGQSYYSEKSSTFLVSFMKIKFKGQLQFFFLKYSFSEIFAFTAVL